ncbi:MAG: DUF4124 domain-containing protein [Ectothiorhodospira sp.]
MPIRPTADATGKGRRASLAWLLAMQILLPTAASGQIYRWVDEDGQMHLSDTPPSEVTRYDREVIDRRGVVREHQEAPPTPAEREARATEEARRQAAEAAANRQSEADRILLKSFGSERELLHTRNDRLALVDAEMERLRGELEDLKAERDRLQETTGDGPQALETGDAAGLTARIRAHEALLEEKRAQRADIAERFQRDLERLRTLRAGEDSPS